MKKCTICGKEMVTNGEIGPKCISKIKKIIISHESQESEPKKPVKKK